MRVLVVSDVHLKPFMFDLAGKIMRSGQADAAIQLGDLFDDWGQKVNLELYGRTAAAALDFHQAYPTFWCMGNHDYGYYHPNYGVRESGHSEIAELTVRPWLEKFKKHGLVQRTIHIIDNVIFSHAGLTDEWVAKLTLDGTEGYTAGDYIETLANDADPALLWDNCSPIWIRPQLNKAKLFSDKIQVVGHTPRHKVEQKGNLISTDMFSTRRDGSPYGEQKFIVVDTEKGTWEYAKE